MTKPTEPDVAVSRKHASHRSSGWGRLRSVGWFVVHLPSVMAARIAEFVFSYWRRAWPTERKRTKALSLSRNEGVNLAAHIRGQTGLGQAARGIAAALTAVRLPFDVVNFAVDTYVPGSDTTWVHKETRNPKHDVSILVINPDSLGNAAMRLPKVLFSDTYVIGYWFWELPEIPDSWLPAFSLVDEVWAASRFIQDGLRKRSPVPVTRIPPVVQLDNNVTLSRESIGLPEEQFLFLCMGDASSVMERKNPGAAIRAFQKAFDKNDSRVGLVLKVRDRNPFRGNMSALRRQIEGWSNIYLLEQTISRQQVNSLLLGTDCFVSLHRSEGFGLGPAEAMSVAKPVIMTRWSGNTDYMTPDNSIGIDYELVNLKRDYGPYKAGQVWAEPDINQAALWMQKLAGDRELAITIGRRARQTIEQELSPETVGNLIQTRLSEIREQYS